MISVRNLTKYYGDFLAVDDLSFEIEEGQVYGFLGPNGAGKSTTMNIITGCLSASAGTVKIGGYDILEEPETAKSMIGYLPEQPPLYMNETPREYLQFVGEARGVRGAELRRRIGEVAEKTGIEKVQHRLISTLSKGYRQRVGIAQALLGNPGVIILDEPTVGLDPIQIIEIRELIRSLGEEHTVIFSSHILSEVRAICDQVLIISGGRLAAFDTPENLETLMTKTNGIYFSVQASPVETVAAMETLEDIGEWTVRDPNDGTVQVHIRSGESELREPGSRIFRAFAEKNLPIFEMYMKRATLEDVFLELTEQGAAGSPSAFEESETISDKREAEET